MVSIHFKIIALDYKLSTVFAPTINKVIINPGIWIPKNHVSDEILLYHLAASIPPRNLP
jgi:hypothetical protein